MSVRSDHARRLTEVETVFAACLSAAGGPTERLARPAVGNHQRTTVAELRRLAEHSRERAAQRRAARAG